MQTQNAYNNNSQLQKYLKAMDTPQDIKSKKILVPVLVKFTDHNAYLIMFKKQL